MIPDVKAAALKAGILTGDVDLSKAIDGASWMPPRSERLAPAAAGRGRSASAADPRARFVGIAAAVFVGLAAAVVAVTAAGSVPLFLPSPGRSAPARRARATGQLPTTGISIYRIIVGFLISTALALPIGVLIGSYRFWEAAIEPLVDFIRYMPVVAFVPLTILWAGPATPRSS